MFSNLFFLTHIFFNSICMSILDILLVILLVAWIGGFSLKIAGGFIHILLIVALVVLVLRLLGVGTARP